MSADYVIPEPTQEELDELAANIATLDPNGEGITMNKLRAFYPRLGWGHIQKRLEALKTAGRASSKLRSTGQKVRYEFWKLEDVE